MQSSTIAKLLSIVAAGAAVASTADAQANLKADRIMSGLSNIVWVGSPPDVADTRIFVVEQSTHDIEVYTNGGTHLGKYLDLTGLVGGFGEEGLLGMAFDPDYATNGYIYVYYTSSSPSNGSRIARYTVNAGNPNLADPGTAHTIIEVTQTATNHNGGNIQFGPDGYLYFAWGDGGGAGDSACNAQKGTTLLGKMVRLDVHGDDFPGDPNKNYAIPADNPFVGDASMMDEVWALGLRNPWRWSFDPHTGDAYIGDVGQNQWEEISFGAAGVGGLNYGWKIMEGNNCFGTSGCLAGVPSCGDPSLTDPIHVYSLSGTPCAVIGGVVYRGCLIPEEYGTYFFADNCDSGTFNNIWSLQYDPGTGTTSSVTNREVQFEADWSIGGVRTFGYDSRGEMLIADGDEVFRLVTDRSFTPDTCDISVSGGGIQNWQLDAGAGAAGSLYFIGGSLTGTAGIPSGSVVVPLSLDAYTLYTLGKPNIAPLINTFANLDGAGTANASFNIPGGALGASVIGTRAYHAYVTLDAFFAADFASNAVAMDFTP